MIDENEPTKTYQYDLNKNKIVREFESLKNEFKDLDLVGGKLASFEKNTNFVAITSDSIEKIDPRVDKYRVQSKQYKSNLQFTKIIGSNFDRVAVGSQMGELRLYNKVNDNAKNLLPSYLGDSIIDMD